MVQFEHIHYYTFLAPFDKFLSLRLAIFVSVYSTKKFIIFHFNFLAQYSATYVVYCRDAYFVETRIPLFN